MWPAGLEKIFETYACAADLACEVFSALCKGSSFQPLIVVRDWWLQCWQNPPQEVLREHVALVFPGFSHKAWIMLSRQGFDGAPPCTREQAASDVGCFVLAS